MKCPVCEDELEILPIGANALLCVEDSKILEVDITAFQCNNEHLIFVSKTDLNSLN